MLSKAIYFIITVVLLAGGWIFMQKNQSKQYGTVIILNGPSTAGKSSIQKEFQHLMLPNLWIKLGIDNLFDKPMPDITLEKLAFWQKPNLIRWVTTTQDAQNNNVITLLTGEQGDKVAYGMNSAIAEYAKAGCNVIVDYIAYQEAWLKDLQSKLSDIPTYWVKVNIPLETLEAREAARGTSPKGHARSHYDTVHWNIKYDLEVNSETDSASTIANQIKDFVAVKRS